MKDFRGSVWMFGENSCGEIGDTLDENVNEPKEMIMFRGIVEEIKTGNYHVYVKCNGGEHYFWGRNDYGQCMVESKMECVKTPHLLNLKEMYIDIINVFVGWNYTIFIVQP